MGCKSEKTKQKPKKGLWSPDEDMKLRNHITKYGHGCWSSVPINAGLQRNGKSCRLRWINYLRPGLKRGEFSLEEEEAILTLHRVLGNKWSQISHHLPGRSDNEIKNHWHSNLKKRVSNMIEEVEGKSCSPSSSKSTPQNASVGSSEASLIDTYQSMQQIQEAQMCNLPKVLFAEWLSLDSFNGPNQVSSSVVTDSYGAANSEESSVHGQQFNEEAIGNEFETKSNLISIDDILQSPFGFEDKSLVDSFTGDFNIYCDDFYI